MARLYAAVRVRSRRGWNDAVFAERLRDCYIEHVNERPTLFDKMDPEREAQADARAEADVREGRLVGHEAVKRWLDTWGTTRPLPRPKVGD